MEGVLQGWKKGGETKRCEKEKRRNDRRETGIDWEKNKRFHLERLDYREEK